MIERKIQARRELMRFVASDKQYNNFTFLLYCLITKADQSNKLRLKTAFPEEVETWEEWQNSEDENTLFALWNSQDFDHSCENEKGSKFECHSRESGNPSY